MKNTKLAFYMMFLPAVLGGFASAQWVKIDLSPWANARIQNYQPGAIAYPEGSVTLGGVPFNIQAVGGNNAWNAQNAPGSYPRILNVPIGVCAATEVHTLINTFYGSPGPTSYIMLEFYGSSGAYHQVNLIGNIDVRDHLQSGWTNTINNTSTINVFTTNGFGQSNRLDKQRVVLPAGFATQTLTSMRLTSTGGPLISDATLQGLTIAYSATYPGSGDDVLLTSAVGIGAVLSSCAPNDVKTANPGNLVALNVRSPLGRYDFFPNNLAAQLILTSTGPGTFPGFPVIHFSPTAPIFFLVGGPNPGPLGPINPILPVAGSTNYFLTPAGLAGLSLVTQAVVVDPGANNGAFAITDAHEIQFN